MSFPSPSLSCLCFYVLGTSCTILPDIAHCICHKSNIETRWQVGLIFAQCELKQLALRFPTIFAR